ncbi:MAG: hypothetical protein JWM10_814 [Myxococcaceae bacterium]|nr:hypothetical protein [Myxococcaceae bacterium]
MSAGAAIGAWGAVVGLSATPADPVDRFVLPAPPAGAERERAIGALVSLLAMEPAKVTVPMVALAFHAPLGGSRCAVHVTGRVDLGKSLRASLVQRLFGAGMVARNSPASWSDRSTAIGIAHVLARAGDALVLIDDLKISGGSRDATEAAKVDHVFRSHFNGSTPLKGRREGGGRTDPASRCDVLSTGETLPKGPTASTLNRVLTVELASPLPGNIGELHARASAGELAAAMAAFLQWLAPQISDLRPRARDEEWDAAMRWGFTAGNRATELLGGLCLGMDFLLRFLGDSGVSAAEVEGHRARAREALGAVAMEHGHRVAEEDPAVRFIDLVGQGLRTGACHVVAVAHAPPPGSGERSATPPEPARWGYQLAHDVQRPCGSRIGYLNPRVPGAVCLEPGPALALARRVAEGTGRQLGVDERSLGMALHAAGMLVRHELDGARRKPTVRPRIFGSQPEVWAVKLEALGYSCTPDGTPDALRGTPGAGADDEVPPFPADLE